MRNFVCVLISLDIQVFLSMFIVTLALPILAATSTSNKKKHERWQQASLSNAIRDIEAIWKLAFILHDIPS